MNERETTEHIREIRNVDTKAPFQEENLYGKETSHEEKTAEKEIPGRWIRASLEMTTIGVGCGCEGTRGGQGILVMVPLSCARSQNTLLDFSRA